VFIAYVVWPEVHIQRGQRASWIRLDSHAGCHSFVYFARPETEELLEWEALAPLGLSSGGFQNLTRLGKTTKAIGIAFCPCLT
jgi:hypothetical protein